MKNKRSYTILLGLAVLLSMGTAVGAKEAEESQEEKTVIGVTLASSEASYQMELGGLLLEAAEKDGSYELEICYADWDAKQQEQQLRDFIEEEADAVILCPVNAKSFLNVLKDARNAGIPVINLNMKVDMVSSEYIATYVGASMSEEADLAAELVVDYFDGKDGTVGIIEGAPGSDPQIYRTQTFLEYLTSYPNIEIVSVMDGGWSREKAALAAWDLLNKNEDLDMIYCHDSAMAMGAYDMMKKLGKEDEVKVIGIGSDQEYIDAVREGKLYGIVTQPVEFEVEYALSCAKRAAKGETLRSWYKNPVEALTKENVDEYQPPV